VVKASSPSYIYIKLITYFIFLYSGLIKWIPFPIDFTLLFGLLTLIFIIYDIYTGEIRLYNINVGYLYLLFYIFSISYMLTYFYSESKVYSLIKVRGFLLNIIAFTFPITSIKIQDSNKIIRVLTVFALLVLLFLSFLLYNDLFNLVKMSDEDQLNLFFTTLPTYLDFGAFIAISFILLINNNSIFSIIFKLIIFYFLIILGGRGPLLTLIFIVFINFLFNNRKLVTVGYFKYLLFLVVGVALYIYFDLTFIDFERLNVFKNYGDDESVSGRFVFVQRCLEGFMDKPILGNGIGSTGVLISGQDIVLYPHNLFVEVLSEFGLIGFFLYLSIFLFFLWIVIIKKVSAEYLPFLFIVLYLFSQDMKSGAFEAWRISCGWLSIATILINYNFNITEKILVNEKVV
jgi:O-antigen ligase